MVLKRYRKAIAIRQKQGNCQEKSANPIVGFLKDNLWLILSVCGVAIVIFIFFAVAHPVVPYDNDDWRFLGQYRSPLPETDQWNPSRILPEISIPLVGHFAAYLIYPLQGDYITSISIAIAFVLCLFTVILFLSFYRLFLALSSDKISALLTSFFVLSLYFVLFKTQSTGNQYFLGAYNKNTYFYYTVPNLLNSIMVCILMRYSVLGTRISMDGLGKGTFIGLAIALYFAIFSMLFSLLSLAVYCFYEIILNFIRRDRFYKILPLLIIVGVIFIYAYFEATGERAMSGVGGTTSYSIFSREFFQQAMTGFMWFMAFVSHINLPVVIIILAGIFFACVLLGLNMEKDKKSHLVRLGLISLLGFVSLLPALIALSGRTAAWYVTLTHNTYSFFFYFMLLAGLCMLYISTKIKKRAVRLMVFIPILFLFSMEAIDTSRPYNDQNTYEQFYYGYGISTAKKIELINGWIKEIKEADRTGAESVTLRIPESSIPIWPIIEDETGIYMSQTLRAHNIITRKFEIILQPDRQLTEELW